MTTFDRSGSALLGTTSPSTKLGISSSDAVTNSIQFFNNSPALEILRLSKTGIWANPDIPVDAAAAQVLKTMDTQIKLMVQKAIEQEREACARVCEGIASETYGMTNLREYGECAAAIRARGQE